MKRGDAVKLGIAAIPVLGLLGAALHWWLGDEIAAFLNYAVSEGSDPGLFMMMFALLPHTLKNYVLALSGVPFKYFFLSGYLIQAAMGIPFVIAGEALAGKSLLLLAAVLAVLFVIYFIVYKIRKRRTWNTS